MESTEREKSQRTLEGFRRDLTVARGTSRQNLLDAIQMLESTNGETMKQPTMNRWKRYGNTSVEIVLFEIDHA